MNDQHFYNMFVYNAGWHQTNKFVKLYVQVVGLTVKHTSNVTCKFTDVTLKLQITDVGNKNYSLVINNLANSIYPAKSRFEARKGESLELRSCTLNDALLLHSYMSIYTGL